MPEAAEVQRMFARVARRYDRTNDVLSLGLHRTWRRRVVAAASLAAGDAALDVCCGTGDVALALAGAGARVTAVDFCREMLALAGGKVRARGAHVDLAAADALRLPFPDGSFAAATVAFGIRNVADPVQALREMRRVCHPGGRVVVLEFSRPRVPGFGAAYRLWFTRVVPHLGALVSGDRGGAYGYLQRSVDAFPDGGAFLALMRAAGLQDLGCRRVSLGVAAVYPGVVLAVRPAAVAAPA
jgi:demethylmenaquinone methyltransferase/2-methoxy-6-polyprenyl-1,4-benzoquinol methylase